MQGDEVALPQHLVEGGDTHTEVSEALRPDARVEADDVHLHGAGDAGYLRADTPEADDAQGLASQLTHRRALSGPSAPP